MKRIAYFFLLLLLSSSAMGQGKFMYGINLGINLASRVTDYPSGNIVGVLAGAEIGYFDWEYYSYSLQVVYVQKGYSTPSSPRILLEYLEIPITFKISPFSGNTKPYFFAGPTAGLLLNKYENGPRVDFGIYGGIGLSLPFSKNIDLFFQVGYNYGLVSRKPYWTDITFNDEGPSREIRIQLGILFEKN